MPKARNTHSFHAFVARGSRKGMLLYPHVHEDGNYVVSQTRFEKDYVSIVEEADLEKWLLRGFGLRMSNIKEGVHAPSLVSPKSIYRAVQR